MTELQFNALCVAVFVIAVSGSLYGFWRFERWFRSESSTRPTREQLLRRQAELEARFKRTHPNDKGESTDA